MSYGISAVTALDINNVILFCLLDVGSTYGSFSEILKISQIFGPTLTIYRYFIALIQFFCISVVRTYTILTSKYVSLLFD